MTFADLRLSYALQNSRSPQQSREVADKLVLFSHNRASESYYTTAADNLKGGDRARQYALARPLNLVLYSFIRSLVCIPKAVSEEPSKNVFLASSETTRKNYCCFLVAETASHIIQKSTAAPYFASTRQCCVFVRNY